MVQRSLDIHKIGQHVAILRVKIAIIKLSSTVCVARHHAVPLFISDGYKIKTIDPGPVNNTDVIAVCMCEYRLHDAQVAGTFDTVV